MAVSLNSVIGFSPAAKYQQVTRSNIRALSPNVRFSTSLAGPISLTQSTLSRKSQFYLLLSAGGDNVITETADKDSKTIEESQSDNGSSPKVPEVNSSSTDNKTEPSNEVAASNGASPAKSNSPARRASLTARERLRAARVLSRYTESNPSSKPKQLGSKLLEALKETDKGKKRPGLPEAPTDLLDDSKRGMPKQGWTINISSGMDVFFIVLSFSLISTLMFATTFLVWKVGAIHFNEN